VSYTNTNSSDEPIFANYISSLLRNLGIKGLGRIFVLMKEKNRERQ
jgi:hypothetical protein